MRLMGLRSACFVAGLAFWVVAASSTLAGDPAAKAFSEANRLYEQGHYAQAAAAYEQIIRNRQASTAIYFNLGNAHFKSGRIGQAIVAYRQAQTLAPRDADVRTNLQLARKKAAGGGEFAESLWSRFMRALTLNEWTILASVTVALWFLLLLAREWRPEWKESLRGYTAATGVLTACMAALLLGAIYERFYVSSAVVVISEAVVRRGPFEESPASFTIRDGAELAVLDRKEQWWQVADAANQIGWVPESQVVVFGHR
jgi:tetratricopeptide (TPR) repeat protein